jgi:hypothetical protein
MIKPRTIILSLVLATTALSPAAAMAKHGADDPAGDDSGGQSTTNTRPDDNPGTSGNSGSSSSGKRAKKIVRVAGSCTGNSTAKLKVKRDRGRLKTEFEVDQNVNGVAWTVKLSRNGTVAVNTTRTTRAPSGSFSIERRLANGAGPDTISATATSPTGEVCTASATI